MAVANHSIKKIIVNIDFISWLISNFLVIFFTQEERNEEEGAISRS